ncbi:hypothetical protein MTR67_031670 [Solanum verrucosum]|uniref:Uncharacterized protein n=1 Tax=Solanum verrucosum TaxID=315347 RepID=A0AAF0ZGJ0_SOLVR|nr:hypothetical protein MTR67_031670 [Solanum verrucosum]
MYKVCWKDMGDKTILVL